MIGNVFSFNKRFSSLALAWIVTAFLWATATHGSVENSIRLYDQASVDNDQIRLWQITQLNGDHAIVLKDVVLATFANNQSSITITLDQLRDELDKLGTNWGKISLRGYTTCVVYRKIVPPKPLPAAQPAPLVTNPIEEIELSTAVTLRQRVVDMIEQFSGVDQNDLHITFNATDDQVLNRSAMLDRYEIRPLATVALGRVPIVISQYHDNRLKNTFRVTADITRRYMVVVAKKTIGRRQTFAPGDVEVREVYLDTGADHAVTDLSLVIGNVAASVIRLGAVVRADQIQSPTLIRRGELITVRCILGDLVIKTVARANENGTLDQLIQVRNDRSHEPYTVTVTGPRQAITLTQEPERLAAGKIQSAKDLLP